ncbi:hypothetical protein BMETH_371354207815, partial [methanotrophic bacterial endosymbiont of Bathymodiolus sp.]
ISLGCLAQRLCYGGIRQLSTECWNKKHCAVHICLWTSLNNMLKVSKKAIR